jgi:hypothetical protein
LAPAFGSATGRVLTIAGEPIEGVAIGWRTDEGAAVEAGLSEVEGRFHLAGVPLPSFLEAVDGRWVTVYRARLEESGEQDLIIAVAERIPCAGVVEDLSGAPLAHALVELRVGGSGDMFSGSESVELRTATGPDGRFEIDAAPAVPGASVLASAQGFNSDRQALPIAGSRVLRLRLRPQRPAALLVSGRVEFHDGSAAAGARVAFGSVSSVADGNGRYRLEIPCPADGVPLVAGTTGWQAAHVPDFGSRLGLDSRVELDLTLPAPERTICGRVEDPRGRPLKGWGIEVVDKIPLDPRSMGGLCAEDLCGAQRIPVRTDADGAFRLAGLSDRNYLIAAAGRGRDRGRYVAALVRVGQADCVLVVPDFAPRASVHGTIHDERGRAHAGVEVCSVVPFSRALQHLGEACKTAEDGSFDLQAQVNGWFHLTAYESGGRMARWLYSTDEVPPPLQLVLPRTTRCRLDVQNLDEGPEVVRALDAAGATVGVRPDSSSQTASWIYLQGPTLEFGVDSTAVELALYRRGSELGRLPLVSDDGLVVLGWP